jgi:NAD(P)-dependent dehydrogenase (short-subunit alcohol dehydrogenase family)
MELVGQLTAVDDDRGAVHTYQRCSMQTPDVADAVAVLVSPDARWVAGQIVETSGGIDP